MFNHNHCSSVSYSSSLNVWLQTTVFPVNQKQADKYEKIYILENSPLYLLLFY